MAAQTSDLIFKNLEDLIKWTEYKMNKINYRFYLKQVKLIESPASISVVDKFKQIEEILKNKNNELKKLNERHDWYFERMNIFSKTLSYKTYYDYYDKDKINPGFSFGDNIQSNSGSLFMFGVTGAGGASAGGVSVGGASAGGVSAGAGGAGASFGGVSASAGGASAGGAGTGAVKTFSFPNTGGSGLFSSISAPSFSFSGRGGGISRGRGRGSLFQSRNEPPMFSIYQSKDNLPKKQKTSEDDSEVKKPETNEGDSEVKKPETRSAAKKNKYVI